MLLRILQNLPNKIQWGGFGEFKHISSSIKQPVLLFVADWTYSSIDLLRN